MPFAVTHVLVPIIITDLVRDHVLKRPRLLPNKFVFLAGIAGLVLDMDLPLYYVAAAMGVSLGSHRIIFHNVWMPLSFLGFFMFFYYVLGRKTFGKVFLMLFVGTALALFMDATLMGSVMPFFPLSDAEVGLNALPQSVDLFAAIDAILLLAWLYHEEFEHKISDYF